MASHYGDRNHRARHFLLKGVGIFLTLGLLPAFAQFPTPELRFYLAVGATACLIFVIIALGEQTRQATGSVEFHASRMWVHGFVLVAIALAAIGFGSLLLEPPWVRPFYILAAASTIPSVIAFGSHCWRYSEGLDRRRAEDELTIA